MIRWVNKGKRLRNKECSNPSFSVHKEGSDGLNNDPVTVEMSSKSADEEIIVEVPDRVPQIITDNNPEQNQIEQSGSPNSRLDSTDEVTFIDNSSDSHDPTQEKYYSSEKNASEEQTEVTTQWPAIRSSKGIVKINSCYALSIQASQQFVPRSPKTAMLDENWRTTMQSEFDALKRNQTWELINRSGKDNVINTKWIFKVKQQHDGSIERYKVRWVANEMKQLEGTDYKYTFSLVVKANSVRLVLTLAISID